MPLRLRVPHGNGVSRVHVRAVRDGESAWFPASVESSDGVETWWRADVELHNPVTSYRFYLDGPGGFRWLTGTGLRRGNVTDGADFRISTFPAPPDWVHDAVVYQVFPDRFARSAAARTRDVPEWAIPVPWDHPVDPTSPAVLHELYGGDLPGVAEHLDHLERLGVSVVYLTPVFPARSNHRYDSTTFDHVDPLLGGDAALADLVRNAHSRGIRVIGDLTTNHTGDTHEWFRRARADATAPEARFYYFRDHPDDYVGWWDLPSLPKLDLRDPELRRRLVAGPGSVVARYLAEPFGLDGWRIDVANMTGRYREIDVAHDVARDIRATMRGVRDDLWLVAEHGADAAGDLRGDGWHGTMNYAGFTRPVWTWLAAPEPRVGPIRRNLTFLGYPTGYGNPVFDGRSTARGISEVQSAMPWPAVVASMNTLDSHDTPRFRTVVGDDPSRQAAGLVLLYAMPGAPTVFAGAELGAQAVDLPDSRIPMPWDRQDTWDRQILDAHATLGHLRRSSVGLTRGGFRWAHVARDSLTFLRESPDERVLVHVAREDHRRVELPLSALGATEVDTLYGDDADIVGNRGARVLRLPDHGPAGHVYRLR